MSAGVNGRETVQESASFHLPLASGSLPASCNTKVKNLHFLLEGKTGFIWSQPPLHPPATAMTNLPLHKTEHYLKSLAEEAGGGGGLCLLVQKGTSEVTRLVSPATQEA